ncbi:hypothetical protein [Gemmobacter serpentinus]|uniref:hypothetical protein n=1 Tax=Gemmobacter serpentinus TaxID=2652247 RepID=UPI00124E43CB|nr:hypothetical protein [Gemmobacter serpentinus]
MTQPVVITDHAVLRYLERVGGFQIEALRAALAARLQPGAATGAGAVVIDGYAYVIARRDDEAPAVTTVIKVPPYPKSFLNRGKE